MFIDILKYILSIYTVAEAGEVLWAGALEAPFGSSLISLLLPWWCHPPLEQYHISQFICPCSALFFPSGLQHNPRQVPVSLSHPSLLSQHTAFYPCIIGCPEICQSWDEPNNFPLPLCFLQLKISSLGGFFEVLSAWLVGGGVFTHYFTPLPFPHYHTGAQ